MRSHTYTICKETRENVNKKVVDSTYSIEEVRVCGSPNQALHMGFVQLLV
jgi:hypothetical protein